MNITKGAQLLLLACLCVASVHAATVPSPIKALYIDWKNINWNAPQQTVLDAFNSGWNVIILAFYLSNGNPADMAQAWAGVPAATQQATINTIHSKGGVVLVSLGGSTDSPFGLNPVTVGTNVAKWAQTNHLDGVDFDLENFASGFRGGSMSDTQTVDWVANATNAARSVLGSGGIISHAPQGPYFGPVGATNTWAGKTGGYTGVYRQAPSINFFNIQFYNQGASCYVDYNGLFAQSCSVFPSTSVGEIAKAGIPLNKIVVGKYLTTADASNGYVAPATLHTFFQQAKTNLGWSTGVMAWVWGDAATASSWIKAVYP
jgi:chitinase